MFQDHYMVKPPDQNLSAATATVKTSTDQIKPTNLLLQTLQNSTSELISPPSSSPSSKSTAMEHIQKKPQLTPETSPAAPGAAGSPTAPLPPPPPLRCPRCDSPNTKFCYYNNYSLSQPRHFCKNCRRYWTKGGALRNVPVGGGCRKNKSRGKQRMFGVDAGASPAANPGSLLDDGVLARLTNGAVNFNPAGPSSSNGAASSDNILHLAFSRFQEAMRQKHALENPHKSSAPPPPLFSSDIMAGLSSIIHQSSSPSPKSSCTCSGCTRAGSSFCNNTLNGYLLNNLIQNPNPKLDQASMTAASNFTEENCNSADQHQLNSFLINGSAGNSNGGLQQISPDHHRHQLNAASATATLASIEEQLSHFSQVAEDNSPSDHNMINNNNQDQQQQSLQFQLLNDSVSDQYTETENHHLHSQSVANDQIHQQISTSGGLSMITSGNVNYMNWQPLMSDMFNLEGDQNRLINHASTWATARSWQENIHGASLAAASATTATAGAGMALY